ncbi:MAG: phosphate/phosphite/phosphonate ABC transporter substrate-binding protein [Nitrospiraceae bacterium]|nr:MAG: phosphate/phosphite/phosphonate ABC transporter substrate-binding protein [Nitrospiraceae bacterium]
MRLIIFFLLFVLFSGISYATELTIGLIPEQNVFKQMKKYKPLGEYIEKKTDIRIKFTVLSRYGNIIDSFEKKKMDGAFWGSFTGAMAIKELGIQPIARPVNPDGNSTYKGYIFVHKYSVIDSVDRMRHSVIAFVDKATTAGYVFPVAYLREHGVTDIKSFFKEHYFTGSHDAAIYAVLNKEAEIGCAKNSIFDMLALNDPRIKEDLKIIATSPAVPSNGLAMRKDIATDIKKKLKKVLLEMDTDPEGKEVLKQYGAIKFVDTTEADYAPVFDLARKAGIDLKNYNYKNE